MGEIVFFVDTNLILLSLLCAQSQILGLWYTRSETRRSVNKKIKGSKKQRSKLIKKLTKKLLQAKKAVKTSSKIVKSANVLELEIQKHLITFVLKHVVVGLIKKGKLPQPSKVFNSIKKLSVKVGWAVAMLPVIKMVDNKELSVPVGLALLILTRKSYELLLKMTPRLKRMLPQSCIPQLTPKYLLICQRTVEYLGRVTEDQLVVY